MLTVTHLGSPVEEPTASVLLAVHRDGPYLDAAIESVLAQEGVPFELVLVVNGGNAALRDRLSSAHRGDGRVVIVFTELAGLSAALNVGISVSRGRYVVRTDADDICYPLRLRVQTEFLDRNTDVGVVGSRVRLIGADSCPIGREIKFCGTDAEIRKVLPYRNPLIHTSLTFRREVLLAMHGYCYGHMSEDHELFLRIARTKWKFANVDEVLVDYRRHPEQITNAGNARKHFVEISGFLFTEFLRSGSPKYLLGMLVVFPPVRSLRNRVRAALLGPRYDGAGEHPIRTGAGAQAREAPERADSREEQC